MENFCDDILTCLDSANFERKYFADSGASEFEVIVRVGKKMAQAILEEFGNFLGTSPNVLVLSGKGHNGADAIACALEILKLKPDAKISLVCTSELDKLKPNTRELARRLMLSFGRVAHLDFSRVDGGSFDLVIDGILGMSFRPPLSEHLRNCIKIANCIDAKLKVSVDLPSGLSDESYGSEFIFRADVTYMTGIAKLPLFDSENAKYSGRLRYIDAGFFDARNSSGKYGIVCDRVLKPLRRLRSFDSDKRSYGHLFIFGGSANFPGAVLMNVKAALRSGVGLLSAFVPESIAASLAAAEPACIWIPCPEDSNGALSLESFSEFKRFDGAQSAILAGSGLSNRPEALALIAEIAKNTNCPMVLDADAIRLEVVDKLGEREALITPHMGEFARIGGKPENLMEFCSQRKLSAILKAPISRICDGERIACSANAGPMLSRAGSGDILAGLAAGLWARRDLHFSAFEAASCASYILGKCSQLAFEQCSESAFSNSEMFEYIRRVLND